MKHSLSYRPDIDGLRALAVIPVVLYHLGCKAVPGGFVGVDIFFVISGFLITSIIAGEMQENRLSLLNFYQRRAQRILPALFLVLAVTTIAALAFLFPADLIYFGESLAATSAFASNILFWQRSGYFAVGSDFIPLLHTWSLAVEEQFYIVFPLLLMATYKFAPKFLKPAILILCGLSFILSVWSMQNEHESAAFYLLPHRAWELLAGSILALSTIPPVRNTYVRQSLAFTGIASIAGAVLFYTHRTDFPGAAALLPVLGAALIIYTGTDKQTLVARALANKIPVFFGKISYSLYLWHWPVVVFFKYASPWKLNNLATIILFSLCTLLSYISWRYIEQPLRHQKRFSQPIVFALTLGIALCFAGIGTFIASAKGLPARYPASLQSYFDEVDAGKSLPDIPGLEREGYKGVIGIEDAKPSFLVWGDSHAYAAIPGIDLIAREHKQKGFFLGIKSCLPSAMPVKELTDSCIRSNAEIIRFIKDHPEIKRIILVAYWSSYDRKLPENALNTYIESLLEELKRENRDIVFITEIPAAPTGNIPFHILRQKLYGYEKNLHPDLEKHAERQKGVKTTLETLQKKYDFKIVDPTRTFCPLEPCRYEIDGHVLYEDYNHISTYGSEHFKDMYRPALN